MAHMEEQIHIRVGKDREIFAMIEEMLAMYPDRFKDRSEFCRAAICMTHRQLKEAYQHERARIRLQLSGRNRDPRQTESEREQRPTITVG